MKHANQRPIHQSSLPDSVPSNGHTISSIKSNRDAGLQPSGVSVVSSGKRKRENESESKPQVGVLKSGAIGLETTILAGHESAHQNPSDDEQEDRVLKKARRKEKKEKKDKKDKKEDCLQHEQDVVNVVAPQSEDQQKGPKIQAKAGTKIKEKKKNKNKESVLGVMDGNEDQMGNRIAAEENGQSKAKQTRAQVDDDTKGGVEPIDGDALEPPEQSADQIQQQRRRSEITTDNDWLRAKTSRILDLTDEAPLTARSAGAEPEEQKPEPAANQDVGETDLLDTPTDQASSATPGSLSTSGRLFVRNLPYSTTESDIETLFSQYGHLEEVRIEHFFQPVFMMIA
jgi:RNA recognition motif. (a.k.a. RRM, RBD, or RNP domain)